MSNDIRQLYQNTRLKFWYQRISSLESLPEGLKTRLDSTSPLPAWIIDGLPPGTNNVNILDVRSGAIPALGTRSHNISVKVTAIDELAPQYNQLLDKHGLDPPVRARNCPVDAVQEQFGEAIFDLIYCYNGLHYTEDPITIYRILLKSLRHKGRIITFHDHPSDMTRFHNEPDRYFYCEHHGEICIRKKNIIRNMADNLPQARITYQIERNILKLELKHKSNPRPPKPVNVFFPKNEGKGIQGLPPIVSVHIPKTGGSSFQQLLQIFYGDGLRCFHSTIETNQEALSSEPLPSNIRCVHGHFQADSFDETLPDAVKVTWLRDPVERVISSYYQYLRTPGSVDSSEFNKRFFHEQWDLMRFARSQEMLNHVPWILNGVPLDHFFFVGITELFHESLALFCHLIGRCVPDGGFSCNINPKKTMGNEYVLSTAQRQELISLYAEEYELYLYVKSRLRHRLNSTRTIIHS